VSLLDFCVCFGVFRNKKIQKSTKKTLKQKNTYLLLNYVLLLKTPTSPLVFFRFFVIFPLHPPSFSFQRPSIMLDVAPLTWCLLLVCRFGKVARHYTVLLRCARRTRCTLRVKPLGVACTEFAQWRRPWCGYHTPFGYGVREAVPY
jgi:hypothetical protein